MNPGFVLPGVVGGVCLLLGLYALQMLPVNYAGLALILLGMAFLVAEAFMPSFGALGLGGIAAFAFGAVMLIDTRCPASVFRCRSSPASRSVGRVRARRRRHGRQGASPSAGERRDAALLGARGELIELSGRDGWAEIRGERGSACAPMRPARRPAVRVTRVDGLTLEVGARGRSESQGAEAIDDHRWPASSSSLLWLLAQLAAHPARVRARRRVPARPLLEGEGARAGAADPGHPADGEGRPAHGGDGRPEAGRDLARQRLGQGQRGGVLPRRRCREGGHPGRELPRRHQPARADHAALGARQARARRDALRARPAQYRRSRRSSTARPTPGASR